MSDITLILRAVERGEKQASEELLPLVYGELRRLAAARMAQEAAGQTLQPTDLVHEAWLRLIGAGDRSWENRAHIFGADIPVCGFTGHSCPVFLEADDWKACATVICSRIHQPEEHI